MLCEKRQEQEGHAARIGETRSENERGVQREQKGHTARIGVADSNLFCCPYKTSRAIFIAREVLSLIVMYWFCQCILGFLRRASWVFAGAHGKLFAFPELLAEPNVVAGYGEYGAEERNEAVEDASGKASESADVDGIDPAAHFAGLGQVFV